MSERAPSPHHSDAGFTLVELLVAMTLLALLSVALVTCIRFGTRIWNAAELAAENDSKIVEAQQQIQTLVEHLYPEFVNPTPTSGYVLFDGRSNRFTFLTPDGATPGELSRVTIGEGKMGQALVLASSSSSELDSGTLPVGIQRVLLQGLSALQISYFGSLKPKQASDWHTTWQLKTRPPDLVRIRIGFAKIPARTWSELIIVPRSVADVTCSYDALRKACAGR